MSSILSKLINLAGNLTGILPIANGGTGQATANAALNALLPSQTGNNTKALVTDGSNTAWTAVATNPLTTLGDILYEDATPTPARLAGNATSTKKFLTQTGTGSVSAVPAWGTVVGADVPVVVPGTTNGVVSSSGLTGATSGSAIGAGFVGQQLTSTNGGNSLTAGTIANIASLSITAGVWYVRGFAYLSGAASQSQLLVGISTDSVSSTFSDEATAASPGNANVTIIPCSSGFDYSAEVHRYINISSTTTYYLKGRVLGANGTVGGYIEAVRVA